MTKLTYDEKELKEGFKKQIEKGPAKIILIQGLIFGFFQYLIICALRLDEYTFIESFLSQKGLFTLLIAMTLGIGFFGTSMWWIAKRTVKKLEEKEAA